MQIAASRSTAEGAPGEASPQAPGVPDDEIERAARALVAAYGPEAIALMQRRTRAVHRRGDTESATLWRALAREVELQLSAPSAGRAARIG